MGLWEQMQRVEKQKAVAEALSSSPKPTDAGSILKAAQETRDVVKRGPKPSGKAKKLLTLRLDPDVIDGYKARGEGWQAQMNADLRKALNL